MQFDFQGKTYEVKARREVILSAGTVNTAQLLLLSGIGPRKELDRFKVKIILIRYLALSFVGKILFYIGN